jgi:hypothetical protein
VPLAVRRPLLGWRIGWLALAGAAQRAEAKAGWRAVLEERARIARELHDVVAHHLSLIAVRAEAAPYRLAGDARTEFGELGGTARYGCRRIPLFSRPTPGRSPEPVRLQASRARILASCC